VGFGSLGQRVFLDVRVFDRPEIQGSGTLGVWNVSSVTKRRKKMYNGRVLQVENDSSSSLVFLANGGMTRECQLFFKRQTKMTEDKRNISTAVATKLIRTKFFIT